jgi:hypothetical protein
MKYVTSLLVIAALFSNSIGMNASLKSRLGKNLAQVESSLASGQMTE